MSKNTFKAKGEPALTSKQVDAITYASMDICATDTHLNGSSSGSDGMAAMEIGVDGVINDTEKISFFDGRCVYGCWEVKEVEDENYFTV